MLSVKIDGKIVTDIEEGSRLIDVLVDNDYKVKQLCGKRGRCATCHVYVAKNPDVLDAQTSQERLTLAVLTGAMGVSRLACQSRVLEDGLEITLPDAIYFQGDSDIDPYVGKPAPTNILHPISGDILIPKGKLIVRSLLLELSGIKEEIMDFENKPNQSGEY